MTDLELTHVGVKGMKWGVRKAKDESTPSPRAAKKIAKEEHKSWRKDANSVKMANDVYEAASKTMNPVLRKINKEPQYQNIDTDRKARQQYDAVVGTIFNQHLEQASLALTTKSFGSAIGTRAMVYQFDRHSGYMAAKEYIEVAAHADTDEFPRFKVKLDADGYVIGFKLEEILEQSALDEDLVDFLEHYGVKGMKWGRRKSRAVTPSADAQRHGSNRKKKSSELSDQELRELVNRINMEQQYSKMNPSKLDKGHNAAKTVLAAGATVNAVIAFAKSPAGKAVGNALTHTADKAFKIPVSSIGITT